MSHAQTIWNYFYNKIGNAYGVAGLMGNLQAESGLYPDRVQGDIPYSSFSTNYTSDVDNGKISEYDFVHNGPNGGGYGLAQWTFSARKQALYNMYKSGGYNSIGSINLACDYLWYELSNTYTDVLNMLRNASSLREASDKVLHDFENPADQSVSVEEKREALGQAIYDTYANTFKPRLNDDGIEGSFYYYSQNPFYQSGYGLPNCTCYAWGRFWEISDTAGTGTNKPTLPTGDAGTWYNNVSGYEKGNTPKLGAVVCWDKTGEAGHVAIVEQIKENGDIVTSNSAWQSTFFYTKTILKSDNYNFNNYVFQGFIYNPFVGGGTSPENPPYIPPRKRKKKFNFILFQRKRKLQWIGKN